MIETAPQVEPIPRILLDPNEAADSLGISTRTLRRWVLDHDLPTITVGGSSRFCPRALREWTDQQHARQMAEKATAQT